jgi:probable blue pigment (indigoidine) exporter
MRTSVAPLVWGTSYLTTTELLPPHRPLLAAVGRALPAGLLLLAVTRRLPRGDWWWRSAVLGGLNIGAFFVLLFVTAARLPGGVAAVLTASQALLVVVLSGPMLGQAVTRTQVVAAVAGVAGIALVVLTPSARLDAVGVLAGLGAAVATAFGIVLTRRWGRPVDLLTFTGWQLTAGGLLLLPLLAVEGLPASLSPRGAAGLAWLAVPGGAIAYALWFDGIAHLRAVAVSSLALLAPVTAAVLGWLVKDQRLGAVQLAGAALALGAVLTSSADPSDDDRGAVGADLGAHASELARVETHREDGVAPARLDLLGEPGERLVAPVGEHRRHPAQLAPDERLEPCAEL